MTGEERGLCSFGNRLVRRRLPVDEREKGVSGAFGEKSAGVLGDTERELDDSGDAMVDGEERLRRRRGVVGGGMDCCAS